LLPSAKLGQGFCLLYLGFERRPRGVKLGVTSWERGAGFGAQFGVDGGVNGCKVLPLGFFLGGFALGSAGVGAGCQFVGGALALVQPGAHFAGGQHAGLPVLGHAVQAPVIVGRVCGCGQDVG